MNLKKVSILIITLVLSSQVFAQSKFVSPFYIERLSEKVLVLTEDSPMENIIVALNSKKGLVVIDNTGSPYTAKILRSIIEKEFGRNDFVYVINTHHHWDHAWGNQVFPEAIIVGHENCVANFNISDASIKRRAERSKAAVDDLKTRLKELDQNSDEAKMQLQRIAFEERLYQGFVDGFKPTPPSMTFDDRMTLDLGDLTLKLYFFGRAHSGSDIFIQIPEEELLVTGDLFLDIGWLPLFAGQTELDIPRWIEVLNIVLDGNDKIKYVVPGHRKLWTKEKLDLWRGYIVDLWAGVNSAKNDGLNIEQVIERFPLEGKYFYLKELGHTYAELERFQTGNVRAFWRQLFIPAVSVVERTIEESDIDAAVARYNEIKSNELDKYYFDEASFNSLGYRLMGAGKTKEAIEIFKLNVEAYPNSWNVYDSLGEAFMNDGQNELAIQNYKKSIELNPENSNGIQMLKNLEKK